MPMFLLAYRSSKHETTGVTPAELYFGRDLTLPLDLLRGSPPDLQGIQVRSEASYVSRLKEKLERIRQKARENLKIKSSRVKEWYDREARQISFLEGQKVWFFNPQRVRGKAPKLQRNWEGPYSVVKKLSEVVFCIQKSSRHRKKIVHSDRLAPYRGRI